MDLNAVVVSLRSNFPERFPVHALEYYSEYSNAWTGNLFRKYRRNETAFKPFNDQANWPPDTHIFTGDQNKGMSGAPVSNPFELFC